MSAAALALQIQALKLPRPHTEYQFFLTRKWRADFCWPAQKVLVEYDGGTFTGGRHTRGLGYQRDCEKLNRAALLGYCVLRFTAAHVKSGLAIQQIEEALARAA